MIEQRFSQSQELRMQQRLALTQEMQQAIHILQLSGLELEQYVQEEIEVNPTLELAQKDPPGELPPVSPAPAKDDNDVFDEAFDLDAYASQWDRRHTEGRDLSYNPDANERRQYYQDSITQEESFSSRLLTQLRMAVEDGRDYRIGERIVGDIDNRGYFTGSAEEIAVELEVPVEDVDRMLRLVQRFEPTGVGARNVVECLLLQIEVEFPGEPELKTLVQDHLDELEHRQIPKIAKAMDVTPERVEELKEMLATLNPWPGHEYSLGPTQYVIPDVTVEKIDDEYVVYLSNERVPELRVNTRYAQMAKNKNMSDEEKKFLRGKIEAAEWLIRSIRQRQGTILRIAQAIVDVQVDFLDNGVEHIKPLTLQEIAEKVGVHESTVSRTTRGKYMQTPQGLFELKYFFSPGLRSDSGEDQSSKSVQSQIKKIIEAEDRAKPLSDQKIADLLKKEGLNIARRTVTKYRENMGILAASMRKEY
jgi:RNA polymerase sigma-54 factor